MKEIISNLRRLYNKVSERPGSLKEYVRRKCDDIPSQKRFRLVAIAFTVFAMLALFVFGKSIYNIYNGVQSNPDFGTIKQLPMPEKGDETPTIDFNGSENTLE